MPDFMQSETKVRALCLAAMLLGCGGSPAEPLTDAGVQSPDATASPDANAGVDAASSGCAVTPTYEELRDTIFTPRCTSGRCHGGTDGPPPQRGPGDFTAMSTREVLVGRASVHMMGLVLVVPGDPENSFLLRKLENELPADARQQGVAMPPATLTTPWMQIPASERESIRCWIAGGAP